MVLSKEAQAGRDLLLDKNNNYELFLRNEGKGNNGEAPELLLAEDNGEVFNTLAVLDMGNIFEQVNSIMRQHERECLLRKHKEWGINVIPFEM